MDEQAEFVMEFVDNCQKDRESFEEIWDEVELNYFVRLPTERPTSKDPLDIFLGRHQTKTGLAVLKDPETHQEIETIASKIVLALFPRGEDFIGVRGTGLEDAHKATVVRQLLQHAHRLPGAFIEFYLWMLGTCIYGTSVIEAFWDYTEEPRVLRDVEADPVTGEEMSSYTVADVPVYDDPRFEWFDIRDFFYDTGATSVERMKGAARRFRITAQEARARAEAGLYDKEAVERAIEARASVSADELEDKNGDETMGRKPLVPDDSFLPLTGFRYVGKTPWKSEDGFNKREIVVLSGETVRSEVWARRIPWFEAKIKPRPGHFLGLSPGEVIRYDQDFTDCLKMMIADAVSRMTHPPFVYDKSGDVDVTKLRAFNPRVPIGANGVNAIQQLPYNPPVQPAFQLWAGTKQSMRESTGALGAVQGLGLGSKRFSASEATETFQQAMDRPEMFAQLIEREYLPQLGNYELRLYQEFLADSADLARRVGQSEAFVSLADILPDFDVEFVGSQVQSDAQHLQALREIVASSSNPIVSQIMPWIPLFQNFFKRIGAEEIAAMVGNPQLIQLHMLLQQQAGGQNQLTGNNNGTTPGREPLGILPQQASGGLI